MTSYHNFTACFSEINRINPYIETSNLFLSLVMVNCHWIHDEILDDSINKCEYNSSWINFQKKMDATSLYWNRVICEFLRKRRFFYRSRDRANPSRLEFTISNSRLIIYVLTSWRFLTRNQVMWIWSKCLCFRKDQKRESHMERWFWDVVYNWVPWNFLVFLRSNVAMATGVTNYLNAYLPRLPISPLLQVFLQLELKRNPQKEAVNNRLSN